MVYTETPKHLLKSTIILHMCTTICIKCYLCKASPTIVRRDDSTNGELSNVRVLILQPITILLF